MHAADLWRKEAGLLPPQVCCVHRWEVSMLRLLARSGAAVVIVGALVFAVPVAAQADVWDTAWFELSAGAAEGGAIGGVIGEGVVAAAPEVASGFACAASL